MNNQFYDSLATQFDPNKSDGDELSLPGEYVLRLEGVKSEVTKNGDKLALACTFRVVKDYSHANDPDLNQTGNVMWERFYLSDSPGTKKRIEKLFNKMRVTEQGSLLRKTGTSTGNPASDYAFNLDYCDKLLGCCMLVDAIEETQGQYTNIRFNFAMHMCSADDWAAFYESPSSVRGGQSVPSTGGHLPPPPPPPPSNYNAQPAQPPHNNTPQKPYHDGGPPPGHPAGTGPEMPEDEVPF